MTVDSTPDTETALEAPDVDSVFYTEPMIRDTELAVHGGMAWSIMSGTRSGRASKDACLDDCFRSEAMHRSTVERKAIAVVDPMSTGANLAFDAAAVHGLPVVAVWSDVCPVELRGFVDDRLAVDLVGEIHHRKGEIGATCTALRALLKLGVIIRDVMVGSEPGVELADELSEALGLRGNGTTQSATRRNKFLQSQACAAAGLETGAQALASSHDEVDAFLRSRQWAGPLKLVVKPVDGAGSQGVSVCDSPESVHDAFGGLLGASNVLGLHNASVLLMEYLGGDEYVVDTVSRDGEHKCVAVWKYIKHQLNGVDNVYHGMRLMRLDAESHLPAMVQYIFRVLDALGVRNGAIHNECKYDRATDGGRARGAVLIESNCRLHGAEGSWKPIAERCLGYSHVSALLDAYDPDATAFAVLPTVPTAFHAHGAQVGIRSEVQGTISRINTAGFGAIRSLPSYVSENLPATLVVGAPIAKTVDIVTLVGQVNLAHEDDAQLEHDLATAQAIISAGLFEAL